MNTQIIHIKPDGMRTRVTLNETVYSVMEIEEKINRNDIITMASNPEITVVFDGYTVYPGFMTDGIVGFNLGEVVYPDGFLLITLEMLAELLKVDVPDVPFDVSYAYLFGAQSGGN